MDATNVLKRICAWCGKDMGTKEGGDGTTHGICPECAEKELSMENQMTPSQKRVAAANAGKVKWGGVQNATFKFVDPQKVENAGGKAVRYKGHVIEDDGQLFKIYDESSKNEVWTALSLEEAKKVVEWKVDRDAKVGNSLIPSDIRKAKIANGAARWGSVKNKNEDIRPQDVNGPYCESCLKKKSDIVGRSGIIHGDDVGKHKCKECGKEATSWGVLER